MREMRAVRYGETLIHRKELDEDGEFTQLNLTHHTTEQHI